MSLLASMAAALAATLALELLFALLWGLQRQQLWIVVLMNVLTNPAANLLYSFLTVMLCVPFYPAAVLLEVSVIITEGLCCRGLVRHPWRFAILCNLFSYAAGSLLQWLI